MNDKCPVCGNKLEIFGRWDEYGYCEFCGETWEWFCGRWIECGKSFSKGLHPKGGDSFENKNTGSENLQNVSIFDFE